MTWDGAGPSSPVARRRPAKGSVGFSLAAHPSAARVGALSPSATSPKTRCGLTRAGSVWSPPTSQRVKSFASFPTMTIAASYAAAPRPCSARGVSWTRGRRTRPPRRHRQLHGRPASGSGLNPAKPYTCFISILPATPSSSESAGLGRTRLVATDTNFIRVILRALRCGSRRRSVTLTCRHQPGFVPSTQERRSTLRPPATCRQSRPIRGLVSGRLRGGGGVIAEVDAALLTAEPIA